MHESEKLNVKPADWGQGYVYEFGSGYRIKIDTPRAVYRTVVYEQTDYADEKVIENEEQMRQTVISAPELRELFPYVEKAIKNSDEFELVRLEDGRSGGGGERPLDKKAWLELVYWLWSAGSNDDSPR